MAYAWGVTEIKAGQHCPVCEKIKKGTFFVRLHPPGYRIGVAICSGCAGALSRAVTRMNGQEQNNIAKRDENEPELPL